ncbi:hypothetical protein JKG47_11260 [Acidithiobacillus sp. MC6.1]|nr:hypothetical protein [Acidithiobacillus sp. MC6.1]
MSAVVGGASWSGRLHWLSSATGQCPYADRPSSFSEFMTLLDSQVKTDLYGLQVGDMVRYRFPFETAVDTSYTVVAVTPRLITVDNDGHEVRFYGVESHAPGRWVGDDFHSANRLQRRLGWSHE